VALALALLSPLAAALHLTPAWVAFGALAALPALVHLLRRAPTPPAPARPEAIGRWAEELALDESATATPDAVVRSLERLEEAREHLLRARDRRAQSEALERECADRVERWRDLAEGVIEPQEDASLLLERLEAELERARARAAVVESAIAERERAEALVEAQLPRREELEVRRDRTLEVLEAAFGELSDPAARWAAWRELEGERDYVHRRARELRRDPRWEALADDPRLALEGEDRPWSASAQDARRARLAELEERLPQVDRRLGEIRAHLEGDPGDRLAIAAERVAELESELVAVRRARDRLALLERVLIEAERRHRAAHQPDVLRRAGDYLASVTGGRYRRLDYPHGPDGPLCVLPADHDEPIEVGPPLSRGTREQIYLCLRLGTLDHLDLGRESLPLILDEALVHWDGGRRAALYPLLGEISRRRQVILFTCHRELAREAHEGLGALVIDLGQGVGAKVEA